MKSILLPFLTLLLSTSSLFSQDADMKFNGKPPYTVGNRCGITGSQLEEHKAVREFVANEDYDELTKWLYSDYNELAAYGYLGLKQLQKKGIEIAPTELEKMEELKTSRDLVSTCQGCMYTKEPFRIVLVKYNLRL